MGWPHTGLWVDPEISPNAIGDNTPPVTLEAGGTPGDNTLLAPLSPDQPAVITWFVEKDASNHNRPRIESIPSGYVYRFR